MNRESVSRLAKTVSSVIAEVVLKTRAQMEEQFNATTTALGRRINELEARIKQLERDNERS